MNYMPQGDVAALKLKVNDVFSLMAIGAAERALADVENPMRVNFFSTAMRILLEHTMDSSAPQAEVLKASWFKDERDGKGPTRAQRVAFAVQGGLSEDFVANELKVDPAPLATRIVAAIAKLSTHVHGRENTIVTVAAEQDALTSEIVCAMSEFLDAIAECRAAVIRPIEEALDEAAVDSLLEKTIQEIDELASHHSIENVSAESIKVVTIGADTLTYRVEGFVETVLQWGSNSDIRRGDGAELAQSFPFTCNITVSVVDPWDLSSAETHYGVDTSEWRKAMGPDDESF